MVNPGSPFDTCTSTETGRPRAPLSVADATAASVRENGWRHGSPVPPPRTSVPGEVPDIRPVGIRFW